MTLECTDLQMDTIEMDVAPAVQKKQKLIIQELRQKVMERKKNLSQKGKDVR